MLSLAELSRCVRLLSTRLEGHRLQQVVQPDAWRVVLDLYGAAQQREDRRHLLLLSCRPETARLSLLERPPRALPRPPAFAQYLRAHAVGATLRALKVEPDDRLVSLDLDTGEGPATLLFSILGRRSNVYWLDAERKLRATLRPLDATRPELALGEAWRPPGSRPRGPGEDRFAGTPDEALFAAIEAAYAEREAEDAQAELRRRVEQTLRKEARRLDRKLEKLGADLASAQAATALARQGELLKGALSSVKRGASEVVVRDWESGEDVTIALDPKLSPSNNLERLFKRYQKAIRRLTRGGAQDLAVREAREELRGLEARLEAVGEDGEALRALAEDPALERLLRRYAPAPSPAGPGRAAEPREVKLGKQSVPRRLAPRRYRTAEGLEIWVGRSDEANDYLTTRLARGRDLFFHLEGAPGSHVILRTEGRDDPPAEALLDACELAVHFSRFKNAGRADVHVVPIRNVKKPKGAKRGLVMVHGGKTVHLRRTPARLERILAARVED